MLQAIGDCLVSTGSKACGSKGADLGMQTVKVDTTILEVSYECKPFKLYVYPQQVPSRVFRNSPKKFRQGSTQPVQVVGFSLQGQTPAPVGFLFSISYLQLACPVCLNTPQSGSPSVDKVTHGGPSTTADKFYSRNKAAMP